MSDAEQGKQAAGGGKKVPRQERLAQALRANLARRKAQARTRKEQPQSLSTHDISEKPEKPR